MFAEKAAEALGAESSRWGDSGGNGGRDGSGEGGVAEPILSLFDGGGGNPGNQEKLYS